MRCNGSHPCHNCTQASLACTFNKPPQKKGPKGSRAKVISELRKTQDHELHRPSSSHRDAVDLFDAPLGSPTAARTPGLLTAEMIDTSITCFFEYLYPTMPILDQARMEQAVLEQHSSIEAYCLLSAFCAFVMLQPWLNASSPDRPRASPVQRVFVQSLRLVEETVRVWNSYDHKDNPTLADILIAFFLSAAYFGLEKANAAWIHLREAMTLAQLLGMHDESTYVRTDLDGPIRRRLFWLLYVSERCRPSFPHDRSD